MQVHVVKSKIHRVKVTGADLNYIGSITIDESLMEASNLIEGEKVAIVNVNNGEQPAFRKKLEETYGTKIAERLDKVNNDAENAVQTKQWLGVQREALNNLPNTGVLDSSKIYLGNLANQLGVKVDMGKISSLEQLSAAGNTITIPLVKQLGYNPTDADARLIGSTIANIGKGKATNLQLNDLIDQASDKQIAKAQIADSLRAQGREAELTQELRNYDLKNPIKVRNPQSSQNSDTYDAY